MLLSHFFIYKSFNIDALYKFLYACHAWHNGNTHNSGSFTFPEGKSLYSSSFCPSGLDPCPSSVQPQPVTRTIPYTPAAATPRPALTASSPRSQTPTKRSSVTPVTNAKAGLCIQEKTGLSHRPHLKGPSQSGVDSSGYSSSEGTYLRPLPATASSSSCTDHSKVQTPNAGYIDRVSSAFCTLIGKSWMEFSVYVYLCQNVNNKLFVYAFWADSALLTTADIQSRILNIRDSGTVCVCLPMCGKKKKVCVLVSQYLSHFIWFSLSQSLLIRFSTVQLVPPAADGPSRPVLWPSSFS